MNNPIAHRKDPLPEASEWVHSGASPNEHQSHARSLWPPSTTYLGDPYRTLTLLSSGGLRASDLLGRPIGRHPITSDLRLLPTHYRRANLSLYPWTSRQSYAHHIQRSHANTARGVCRRRQYFHCCDRWRRTYVMYGEWRAMGLRARKAFGWGYVSGIKSRSGRHRTNTFCSARRGVSHGCSECAPTWLSRPECSARWQRCWTMERWSDEASMVHGLIWSRCGDIARIVWHSEKDLP